jgi:hypothetical protein
VHEWMRTDDIECMGAIYSAITRHFDRIQSTMQFDEYHPFVMTYLVTQQSPRASSRRRSSIYSRTARSRNTFQPGKNTRFYRLRTMKPWSGWRRVAEVHFGCDPRRLVRFLRGSPQILKESSRLSRQR